MKLNRITGKTDVHVRVEREGVVELSEGVPAFVKIFCQNRPACMIHFNYSGDLTVCQSLSEVFPDETNCQQSYENPKKVKI